MLCYPIYCIAGVEGYGKAWVPAFRHQIFAASSYLRIVVSLLLSTYTHRIVHPRIMISAAARSVRSSAGRLNANAPLNRAAGGASRQAARWASSSSGGSDKISGPVIGIDLGTTNSCVSISVRAKYGNSLALWLTICPVCRKVKPHECWRTLREPVLRRLSLHLQRTERGLVFFSPGL